MKFMSALTLSLMLSVVACSHHKKSCCKDKESCSKEEQKSSCKDDHCEKKAEKK